MAPFTYNISIFYLANSKSKTSASAPSEFSSKTVLNNQITGDTSATHQQWRSRQTCVSHRRNKISRIELVPIIFHCNYCISQWSENITISK